MIRNLATNQGTYIYNDANGHALSVAPPNLGPKSTPAYEATLGQPSVFTLANGMRVFAGPRDDAFYFDSGATFDTLNFRAPAPMLTGAADTNTGGAAAPAAVDGFAGLQHQPDRRRSADHHADLRWHGSDRYGQAQRSHRCLGFHPPPDRHGSPQPATIPSITATTFRWTAWATRLRWKL